MNLSPARLAVIVALVVGGIAVLLNGFEGSSDAAAVAGGSSSPSATLSPGPTTSSSPTAPPTETPKPETDGVTFMVFNGTSTLGLGATVQQVLEDEGYVSTQDAGNAITPTNTKTIVYFKGGGDSAQNESNATNMAEQFLGGAKVALLGEDYENEVPADTQLVVIVGSDYEGATA